MKIKLNYWQLLLLFSPFFAALAYVCIPPATLAAYHINSGMVAIAVCVDIFIALWYQVYLVMAFNKRVKGSVLITINNITAVLGTFVFIAAFVYMALEKFNSKPQPGPIHSRYASWGVIFVGIDLLHLIVTFFLINNLYISFKTEKIKDPVLHERVSNDFGEPMKRLLITSLFVSTGSFVIAVAIRVIKARF